MSNFKGIVGKLQRYTAILLSVLLCLTLISCGGSEGHSGETKPPLESSVQQGNGDGSHDIEYPGKEIHSDPAMPSEGKLDESENLSEVPSLDNPEIILPEASTFLIKFINVGQADAALVECDGHYMLIDGGNSADSNLVYSVLKKANISHLDIVVGTHAHEDHIGGLPGAFNYADADLTLCATKSYDSVAFNDFKRYADQRGGGIVIPSVGDKYSLGSATVNILGVNGANDTNNTSIVLMITYGETKFLFTGDAEREAEQTVLASGVDLSADVLKVGHHGSDTSTTYPFLRAIMPEHAVISVGTGNSYGHPTEDTLSRLRDADVKVYRTDLQGDIECTSDGKSVSFSVTKNQNADTLASVSKQETTTTPTETPTPKPEPSVGDDSDNQSGGTDYIVNVNTGKFHYPTCLSAKKMKESNKLYYTGTRNELLSQGYSPCGNCNP